MHKKWLNRILSDGFAHVKLIIHQPGCMVYIDPRIAFNEVEVYPDTFKIVRNPGERQVYVRRLIDPLKHRGVFRLNTCVEQVKAFLGIRNPLILTPKQLYREVKK